MTYVDKVRWHISALLGIFFTVVFITLAVSKPKVIIPTIVINWQIVGAIGLIVLSVIALTIWSFIFLRKYKTIEKITERQ